MKKRFIALFLALVCCALGTFGMNVEVRAEDATGEDVELAYLLTEDALIGYAELKTRGVYLSEGYSAINNAGAGKIGCGGVTNASLRCQVSVTAIVERKVNGTWVRVTSWTQTNTNALRASVSKYLSVTSGYYYRVRSSHYASTDSSSSWTAGLWM